MRLSVIIPCHNESKTISTIVERVLAVDLPSAIEREIIVVDDGSDEATKTALLSLSSSGHIRLITRAKNGGKGAAVKDGLAAATGDYCIIQDGDLEYDPGDYIALLTPILEKRAEVAIGVRPHSQNNVSGRYFFFLGGRVVNWFFNTVFRTSVSDLTTCYKLFPKNLVARILQQPSNDFVFDAVELSYVLTRQPYVEVPISYTARGTSAGKKIRLRDGLRCLMRIVTLRFGAYTRIVKFLIVGSTAALVNITVLFIATNFFHVWYLLASILSFSVALAYNFYLQKLWTFGLRKSALTHGLAAFAGVNVVNLLLNTAGMYLFVDVVGLWYISAQLLTSAIIGIESFIAYHYIFDHPKL